MCAGVSAGLQERSRPLIADTAAAAAEVPPVGAEPSPLDDSSAEAATSTQAPRFEFPSSVWLSVPIEATRIASGFVAASGFAAGFALPLFPAPATTVMPRPTASVSAAFSDADGADPGTSAKDRLITRAPCSEAQRIPRAIVSTSARPSASEHLHRQDAAPAADAGCSEAVVENGADQRCLLAAVAVLVRRTAPPSIALKPGSRLGVRSGSRPTPGVDDRDHDAWIALVTRQARGTAIDSSPARLSW